MKLKLIQSGGFAGLRKSAEEELDDYPEKLKNQILSIFQQPLQPISPTRARDKEQHFLELEGKIVPVQSIKPQKELQSLLKKMKANLSHESR